MNQSHQILATIAIVLASTMSLTSTAIGQATTPTLPAANPVDAAEAAARRDIVNSDRWRQTMRGLNNWLATQRIYTQDEVRMIQAQIDRRVSLMNSTELKNFLDDTEERLVVLTGPDAQAAGQWVSQFLATARNAQQQLQQKRPDVLNMTASQIQQELDRFNAQRGARQNSQAAFQRGQAQQVQSAQGVIAANQQAQNQQAASRARAATGAQARRDAAMQTSQIGHTDFTDARSTYTWGGPAYTISPWGTPIRWNPLSAPNR